MQPELKRKRWLFLGALYVLLVAAGWYAGDWLTKFIVADVGPLTEPMLNAMIVTAAGLFVVTSAVPFVPGAEIGFGLLLVFGANIAVLVYVCMVSALMLAYLAGRFVPATATAAVFAFFGLLRARDMVLQMAPLNAAARLEMLTANAPSGAVPMLLRHRYLALVVLLNLPGNSILGGGGGIAFAAGMSGLYRLPAYLISVLVSVSPIPLFFLLAQSF